VSSVNLLEGVPDYLANSVSSTITSILDNPAALVDQLESNFARIEVFFKAMPAQAEYEAALTCMADLFSCIR